MHREVCRRVYWKNIRCSLAGDHGSFLLVYGLYGIEQLIQDKIFCIDTFREEAKQEICRDNEYGLIGDGDHENIGKVLLSSALQFVVVTKLS